jgi:acyl-CoA reductase-like NAD-dependent aldehyde dehydrogenase
VITAGNFPVAVPSWYLIPALLCGNCVVWKPAEYAPASGARCSSCWCAGGGLPDGVLNLVLADGETTFAGLEHRTRRGLRRQGRVHRVERRSARGSAS